MIKILLTADMHWGTQRDGLGALNAGRLQTFERIAALAAEHHLLLIAGDFFDGLGVDDPAYAAVNERLAALRDGGTAIVCIPGETELDAAGAPLPVLAGLAVSRVYAADAESPFRLERDGETVFIYGFPANSTRDGSVSIRVDEPGFHIGLLHGNFIVRQEGESVAVNTFSRETIRGLNLDFYALGHIHGFRIFKHQNRVIGATPGSPEPTSLAETGERAVLSIAIENNEVQHIRRLIVNTAEIRTLAIDCGAVPDDAALFAELERNASPTTFLSITLTGRREFAVDPARLAALRGCALAVDLRDESIPGLGALCGGHGRENSLRGEFFGLLDEIRRRGGIPESIDPEHLQRVLTSIAATGAYRTEDWL